MDCSEVSVPNNSIDDGEYTCCEYTYTVVEDEPLEIALPEPKVFVDLHHYRQIYSESKISTFLK